VKNFEHMSALSIEGAVGVLDAGNNSRVIAGGTDLLTEMKLNIAAPDRLVSLKTIPHMNEIQFDEPRGLRLGAMAKLAEIAGDKNVIERFPLLSTAILSAASPQLRNSATIGGNLMQDSRCWYYRGPYNCWLKGGDTCFARDGENAYHAIFGEGPCHSIHPSDPAPALIALQAEIGIAGPKGKRILRAEQLFHAPHELLRKLTIVATNEIITEVRVPVPKPGSRQIFLKARERRTWAFALTSVALAITFEAGLVKESRVVLGGVANTPRRLREVEAVLKNQKLDGKTIQKATNKSVEGALPLAHNSYKIPLIKGIVSEALTNLAK
jgi:xanthine dehydrogenase YagS FAD-binding subunit